MRFSVVSSAFVAAIVGFGGTLALIINAAKVLGATQAQTASFVTAICIAIALSSFTLSWRYKMPLITAWSTPGLALIAATHGYSMHDAVFAFLLVGVAIFITAMIEPLLQAIARIPASICSGMLAGVLFSFVVGAVKTLNMDISFVLPLIFVFFIIRLFQPALAVIAVLILGFFYAYFSNRIAHLPPPTVSTLEFIAPSFHLQTIIGLALPLYLVTMASQNLPGFAVLQASGYKAPAKACLSITGFLSILISFFGAVSCNMAAISAVICTNPDAHKDKTKRWLTGPFYSGYYIIFAVFGASLVAIFAALPLSLIALVAGLGLLTAFVNSVVIALAVEKQRLAAIITFAVTASNISIFDIGAPFWALVAGLFVLYLDRLLKT